MPSPSRITNADFEIMRGIRQSIETENRRNGHSQNPLNINNMRLGWKISDLRAFLKKHEHYFTVRGEHVFLKLSLEPKVQVRSQSVDVRLSSFLDELSPFNVLKTEPNLFENYLGTVTNVNPIFGYIDSEIYFDYFSYFDMEALQVGDIVLCDFKLHDDGKWRVFKLELVEKNCLDAKTAGNGKVECYSESEKISRYFIACDYRQVNEADVKIKRLSKF